MANFLSTADVDAIQDYYLEEGPGIFERVMLENLVLEGFTVLNGAKDAILLEGMDTTEMLQRYQSGWTPKGAVNQEGRLWELKLAKIDLEIYPRDYHTKKYIAKEKRSANNDPYELLYANIITQKIMKQMYEDFVTNALWTGSLGAITPGTPTTASAVVTGFETLIQAEITATNITEIATGALGTTGNVAKVRTFVHTALDTTAKLRAPHILFCSVDEWQRYRADYELTPRLETGSSVPWQLDMVHGANVRIIPQDGLTGDQLVLTRQENLVIGFNGAPNLEFEREKRKLNILGDWGVGLQLHSIHDLYRNNQ